MGTVKYEHQCKSEFEWHLFRNWGINTYIQNSKEVSLDSSNDTFMVHIKNLSFVFKRMPLGGTNEKELQEKV